MPRVLVCGRCGATFECSGTQDCWCASIKIEDPRLAEIADRQKDCLCKDCLMEEV